MGIMPTQYTYSASVKGGTLELSNGMKILLKSAGLLTLTIEQETFSVNMPDGSMNLIPSRQNVKISIDGVEAEIVKDIITPESLDDSSAPKKTQITDGQQDADPQPRSRRMLTWEEFFEEKK